MFLSGVLSSAGLKGTDPEEERDPPPSPTSVTFPVYEACQSVDWDTPSVLPTFQALFARVLKPADISKHHAEALNIEISAASSIDELLPLAPDGTSYLPPLAPEQAITPASYANATKADPVISRKRKEFDDRLTELRVDNDAAYRTLTRTLKNGTKGPRLAYMRKFWEGLESMSQYWDCSLDQYYEVSNFAAGGEKSAKRQRLDLEQDSNSQRTSGSERIDAHQKGSAFAPESPSATSAPLHYRDHPVEDDSSEGRDRRTRSTSTSPEPHKSLRYKGRRTHNGREMPDSFRGDTVRAFVEGTIWPFQCSVAPPRHMPIVQFSKLNLPVRQTAAVYRLPKDRTRARQGRLEGPMVALQVRADTDFLGEDDQPLQGKARLDLMRELGGLLQIAQERRREGKTEVKPGEGKWWTTKPRWGGGPGGEVQSEAANVDVSQATEKLLDGIKEAKGSKEKDVIRSRRRKTPALLWKELKCGSGHWDPKTDYMAVGKETESKFDEVFMVSSLNHHISILKLTVHEAYVDFLVSGAMPNPRPDNARWCRPKLQRSRWLDLFDMEQRVEAFRDLWGVMAYLTREAEAGGKTDASDTAMSGTG